MRYSSPKTSELLRIFFLGGFFLTIGALRALAAAPELAVTPVEESSDNYQFTFEVAVPEVETSGAAQAAEVLVRGMESRERRPGFPDLPARTVLVAIPPGVTPVLEVRSSGESLLRSIVPRAAAVKRFDRFVDSAGAFDRGDERTMTESVEREALAPEERIADPKIYAGDELVPQEIASLGKIGVLRDQRYVEVHLAPVRYDPSLPGLRVSRAFEVTVRFEGGSGARVPSRPEPVFEGVYRNAFVNYAQGTQFRLSTTAPPTQAAVERTLASKSLTSGPLYRIRIRQNGIVRLDYNRMSSTPFVSAPVSTWKLTSRGVEVPIQVQDDGDDVLEPGEWVQFYGQALDDEPKTVVNTHIPNVDDLYELRDFSDENIYFLSVEAGARSRIPTLSSVPTNTRIPPTDFETTLHAEVDDTFKPLFGNDPWYWTPYLCIGCGAVPTSRNDVLALPGLIAGDRPVRAVVRVRGSSEDAAIYPDHRTRVTLQNASSQTLATNNDDGTFDGRVIYTHDFTWTYPGAGPQASNPLTVTSEVLVSGTVNQVVLDWIELHYQRSFATIGDVLAFDWPNSDAEFIVSSLAAPNPVVYEITDHVGTSGIVNTVRLTNYSVSGAGPYSIRFRVDQTGSLPASTPRHFVVSGDAVIPVLPGADLTPDTVSDLKNTSNQADFIIIANPLVIDASPGSPLSQFIALRASQGITAKIALIEDVQDEFNDGLAGPTAIENLLRWVFSTNPGEGWASPKPTYVLLLGDASYDYKAGTAQGNYVPTQILVKNDRTVAYYASDNVLADFAGDDQLADVMIGRISTRSVADTNVVLQKILSYAQSPPAGAWRSHALFISDRGKNCNPVEWDDFESINNESEAFMKRPPHTSRQLRYRDYCPVDQCPCYPNGANNMRAAIKSAVNGTDGFSNGAAIVQYVGHGNYEWWSDDAFFDDFILPPDTASLVNGGKLPWLMVHTCLTGGFHQTGDVSMGEDWIKRNGGGAIAVFAPSGLDFTYIGHEVAGVVWNDMFGPPKRRDVATPVLDSLVHLCSQGSTDTCQHYTFLGDPSMSLILPSVGTPGVPVATPSSLRVDLSWTASLTPGAKYDVYRATTPLGTYTRIAQAVVGTTLADTQVMNETTYYYYVVAVDVAGYESAWSNFNSDCPVSGPDCVKATPTNPNAPAPPTGLTATDTERGGNLRLSWNANTEVDLRNYTVWYGTTPGSYPNHLDAGKATTFGLAGLTNGEHYYIVLTATNLSQHTSGPSNEVNAVPTSVQGIKAPTWIQDLHVNRSGSNAVLTWGAITTDIYGKPITIDHYEVFRGAFPDFVPSPGNRIGTPASPTFTDVGAISLPGSASYLVRAIDTFGNAGGLGNDLPNGISFVQLSHVGVNVALSWPAVTTSFSGGPTRIDHYNVYVSTSPFTRAQIRDGVVPVFTTVTGTSIQITPASFKEYYSILAVDTHGSLSPF